MAIPQYVSDILLISKDITVLVVSESKMYTTSKMFKEECWRSDCLSFFASCRSLLRRKNAFSFLKKLWTVFIVCTSQSTLVALFSSRTGCFKGHYHYHPWKQVVLSVSGMCCFGISLWCNLCHENIHPSAKTPTDNCVLLDK